MRVIRSASPDHADQYSHWSKAARQAKATNPKLKYGQYLRVEHGTPRRQFARIVLDRFRNGRLSKKWMDNLCDRKWEVAVITLEEDRRLKRSSLCDTPRKRWAEAKIRF